MIRPYQGANLPHPAVIRIRHRPSKYMGNVLLVSAMTSMSSIAPFDEIRRERATFYMWLYLTALPQFATTAVVGALGESDGAPRALTGQASPPTIPSGVPIGCWRWKIFAV